MLAKPSIHGWIIPLCVTTENIRPETVILKVLNSLGIRGQILYITYGTAAPRAATVDWLCVINAELIDSPEAAGFEWSVPHDLVRSSGLLSFQQTALRRFCDDLDGKEASETFRSVGWPEQIRRWIDVQLGPMGIRLTGEMRQFRSGVFESVAAFPTTAGHVYFKGKVDGPFTEARLAGLLSSLYPTHFPRTIAFDPNRGWWLMAEVAGRSLAEQPTLTDAASVAAAVARMQVGLLPHVSALRDLGVDATPVTALEERALDLFDRVLSSSDAYTVFNANSWGLANVRAKLSAGCRRVRELELPVTWVHSDLDPLNVFHDGYCARLIDLADSWIGPAPVILERFIKGLRGRLGADFDSDWETVIRAAYVDGWNGDVPASHMHEAWQYMRLISRLFQTNLELRELETRTRRGEIFDYEAPATRQIALRLCRDLEQTPDPIAAQA